MNRAERRKQETLRARNPAKKFAKKMGDSFTEKPVISKDEFFDRLLTFAKKMTPYERQGSEQDNIILWNRLSHYKLRISASDLANRDKKRLRFIKKLSNTFKGERFWTIFGILYISFDYPNLSLDEIYKCVKTQLVYPLEMRLRWSNQMTNNTENFYYDLWSRMPIGAQRFSPEMDIKQRKRRQTLDDFMKFHLRAVRKLKDEDEVTLYRGFTVDEKDDIRVGRTKIGNIDAEKEAHKSVGLSYSLDKDVAASFSTRNHLLSHLKGIHEMSGNALTELTYKQLKNRLVDQDRITAKKGFDVDLGEFTEEFYNTKGYGKETFKILDRTKYGKHMKGVIGTYTVKKKDIISGFNNWGEREMIAHPKDVSLKHYEFITERTFQKLMKLKEEQQIASLIHLFNHRINQ